MVAQKKFFNSRKVMTKAQVQKMFQGRIAIGFSGYTKPPDGYMERAKKVVKDVLEQLGRQEKGAVVYGASDAGIDQIVESLCTQKPLDMPIVGITCPEFASYVPDEDHRPPVVVMNSRSQSSKLFVELLDILVITGGREHTFRHDLQALSMEKRVLVCNCAPDVPSYGDRGEIANAASLLQQNFHFQQYGSADIAPFL